MTVYATAMNERTKIKAWIDNALSETVKNYRLQTLAQSFGLSPAYVERYVNGISTMGHRLRAEIVIWCDENPNVSPNAPVDGKHWIADIDLN